MTVRQPYAWAIAEAIKLVENRGTNTRHRGLVGLHAGRRWFLHAASDPTLCAAWRTHALRAGRRDLAHDISPRAPWMVWGAIIAVAEIVDAHRDTPDGCCRPWGQERHHRAGGRMVPAWHWCLNNVRQLAEPVPCRGQVMPIWTVPDDVTAQVRRQVAA